MSKFIEGFPRRQTMLFPISLEESIAADNEVRFIDAFVSSLDLESLGFKLNHVENGRPAYHPSILIKLYLYGYLNRIRSSRSLEKECKRNIEVMWLLETLAPDHNTISNFRRDNPKAIKRLFRESVKLAKHFNLIGERLLAGDSTKLRAQNSKKNNYNQKKIDRHLLYIEKKLEQHENELAQADGDKEKQDHHKNEIKKHQERQANYQAIEKELEDSGDSQISTTDPDSRHLITRNNITEVAYCVQTTVDAKHNIPIDYLMTNANDSKAMGIMLRRTKTLLRHTNFTMLYDKGYHTGSELAIADHLNIYTLAAIPNTTSKGAPDPNYNASKFSYHQQGDYYLCPAGEKLRTNGTWHNAKNSAGKVCFKFQQYTTKQCKSCEHKPKCTRSKENGRAMRRSEYTQHIEANKQRFEVDSELYKRRQAIVEHPYGTMKRQWGFNHIITKKGKDRASADFGWTLTAYNLKRIINLVGLKELINRVKSVTLLFATQNTKMNFFSGVLRPFLHKQNYRTIFANAA